MNINLSLAKNYMTEFNKLNKTNYRSILMTQAKDTFNTNGIKYISNQKKSVFKTILNYAKEFKAMVKENSKAMGINCWDILKAQKYHTPIMPRSSLYSKLKNIEVLAPDVQIKMRKSSKTISGRLEKLTFKDGSTIYVLKNQKNKQLGYMQATKNEQNELYIDFLTNILGRKKYKNIETTLLQGAIEDSIKAGNIPTLKADAVSIADNMGRGYNNSALYKRMGMETGEDAMYLDSAKLKEIISSRIAKFGEIINGTSNKLNSL